MTAYCSPPAKPKSDGLATGGWPGWLVVLVHGLPPRHALQFEPMLALHAVLAAVRGLLAAIEETAHQATRRCPRVGAIPLATSCSDCACCAHGNATLVIATDAALETA